MATQIEGTKVDQLDLMIAWEEGELDEAGTVELFQGLIDSGLVWRLQGCYGRMADALIRNGLCNYRKGKDDGRESQV